MHLPLIIPLLLLLLHHLLLLRRQLLLILPHHALLLSLPPSTTANQCPPYWNRAKLLLIAPSIGSLMHSPMAAACSRPRSALSHASRAWKRARRPSSEEIREERSAWRFRASDSNCLLLLLLLLLLDGRLVMLLSQVVPLAWMRRWLRVGGGRGGAAMWTLGE